MRVCLYAVVCPRQLGHPQGGMPHDKQQQQHQQQQQLQHQHHPPQQRFVAVTSNPNNKFDNKMAVVRVPSQSHPNTPSASKVAALSNTVPLPLQQQQQQQPPPPQSYYVETITMTTVTERHFVSAPALLTDNGIKIPANATTTGPVAPSPAAPTHAAAASSSSTITEADQASSLLDQTPPALPAKESASRMGMTGGLPAATTVATLLGNEPIPDPNTISGILKGGKLWKSEQTQVGS